MRSIAEKSLDLCQLFEAELLLELMLRYWAHPRADDREFRSHLLETATEVLREAVGGASFIEGVVPSNMNFVAAVYYAETRSFEESADTPSAKKARQDWLATIGRSLPSCFCDPDLLG